MDPMIGQALGHYRFETKLGEGGIGVVFRAFDTHLDRPLSKSCALMLPCVRSFRSKAMVVACPRRAYAKW
jgi:hypothetical protein